MQTSIVDVYKPSKSHIERRITCWWRGLVQRSVDLCVHLYKLMDFFKTFIIYLCLFQVSSENCNCAESLLSPRLVYFRFIWGCNDVVTQKVWLLRTAYTQYSLWVVQGAPLKRMLIWCQANDDYCTGNSFWTKCMYKSSTVVLHTCLSPDSLQIQSDIPQRWNHFARICLGVEPRFKSKEDVLREACRRRIRGYYYTVMSHQLYYSLTGLLHFAWIM